MTEKTQNRAIGERLRLARIEANRSQAEVAQELRISRQSVGAWESGEATVTAPRLGDLAILYGVSADYLLFGIRPFDVPKEIRAHVEKLPQPYQNQCLMLLTMLGRRGASGPVTVPGD